MFNSLMKRHGQRLLYDMGWPESMDICWSLSPCQGDGYAFYGTLDNTSLLALLPHITQRYGLSEQSKQRITTLLTLHDISAVLKRNNYGYYPCHAGGISITVYGFPDGENAAFMTFYSALKRDVKILCNRLELDSYTLRANTMPHEGKDREVLFRCFTENFELRVEAVRPDGRYRKLKKDILDSYLDELLLHDARLLDLELKVISFNNATNNVVATEYLSSMLIAKDTKPRHWPIHETIRGLMSEARENIRQLMRIWTKILPDDVV